MKNILATIATTILIAACNRDSTVPISSTVGVRFLEDKYNVPMQYIDGNWSPSKQVAELSATGYKHEQFRIYLAKVTDTGNIPNPTIENIGYTDGLDFVPDKFRDGFIHITNIDSLSVDGNFQVALDDNFNGAETRVIVGSFLIKKTGI